MFQRENRNNTLSGILFVALFAMSATYLGEFSFFQHLGISPLIIGIVLGMIYANTLRSKLPKEWVSGILFSTKTLLRAGIILYGFRITFYNIQAVGLSGIATSAMVVTSTFIIGYIVGTKWLKLDRETNILTSAGSSICGAAAVLATEPVVNAEAHKSAIAVSFVVIFGTIAMFLYPFIYKLGVIDLSSSQMGVYIGATLHEVAHVVGASTALGEIVSKDAIIVKMIRVIFIVPFLILLSLWLIKTRFHNKNEKSKVIIPWFAVMFIVVVGFNSFGLLSQNMIANINFVDNFTLTMAMSALGIETSFDKFKNVGMKPFYLSLILFIWLMLLGFFLVKFFF